MFLVPIVPMFASTFRKQAISGNMVWEQTVIVQKFASYKPMVRFNPQSTYMFVTPYFVQQGKYQVQNNHYSFRAVTAIELEVAESAKFSSDMNQQTRAEFAHEYAESMHNFEADFDPATRCLTVNYAVGGKNSSYELYATTDGDDQLVSVLGDSERAIAGLWHAPDPFPDRLDAKTRIKIEEDGLHRFVKEAMASDAAQFGILDLRVDGTFRIHALLGRWKRSGNQLSLIVDGRSEVLTISADGMKLLAGGKTVYLRN